jgi:hypothetical protein
VAYCVLPSAKRIQMTLPFFMTVPFLRSSWLTIDGIPAPLPARWAARAFASVAWRWPVPASVLAWLTWGRVPYVICSISFACSPFGPFYDLPRSLWLFENYNVCAFSVPGPHSLDGLIRFFACFENVGQSAIGTEAGTISPPCD